MWTFVDSVRRVEQPSVVEFAQARLGFWPDSRQQDLLKPIGRGLVCCCRQWGKSTLAAVMAVHRAYFRAKSLVVVACPTEKQSAELVWKARDFMAKLGLRQR